MSSRADSENSTAMPAGSTRRSFLSTAAGVAAGGAVLALAAIPPVSAAAAPAGSPDPIFAMIVRHKKLQAEWMELHDRLDEAEVAAYEVHGRRPPQMIYWRGYTICDSEIDIRREALLEAGKLDPATVEQEYAEAKASYQEQVVARRAWDERAGLAALGKDADRREAAERRYAKRLARTKPTTLAGVAALIQYILDDDLVDDEDFWHMTALKTAVAALNSIGAGMAVTS